MQFKCKRRKELLTIALLLGDGQIPSFTTNAPKLVLKEAPVGFFISKYPYLWPQIHLHSAAFWFRKKPVSLHFTLTLLSPLNPVCGRWWWGITLHSRVSSCLHSGSPMTKNEYFDVIASDMLYYLLITTWNSCFWWDFYALHTINMESMETKFCFKFKQFSN